MKKFLIALLAALLVVGMATVAFATEAENSGTGTWDKDSSTNLTPDPYTVVTCKHENTETVALYPDGMCNNGIQVVRCTDCHTVLETVANVTVPGAGHQFDYTQVRNVIPGNCSKTGSEEVYCLRCKQWVKITTGGSHDFEYIVEKKATCRAGGISKRVCKICGEWDTINTDPTGDHKFDLTAKTTFVSQRGTCETDGTYCAICTVCGGTFEWGKQLIASVYGGDDTVSTSAPHGTQVLRIKATGHKWDAGQVIQTANCALKRDGIVLHTCQNNVQTATHEPCYQQLKVVTAYDEEVFDPRVQQKIWKSHTLVEHVEKAATATTYGMHWYSCSTCGEKWGQTSYLASSAVSYNGQWNGSTAAGNNGTTTPTKSASSTTKPASSTNKKGVSIPKTNDTTSNLPYVLIAVAFVGLVALVASKKKVNG